MFLFLSYGGRRLQNIRVLWTAELRAEYDEKNGQYRLIATGFGAH